MIFKWLECRFQKEAQRRAQLTYNRREDMIKEIVPLSEVGGAPEDIQVCLGCGELVLRGWKDLHIAGHAWHRATNPYGYLDTNRIHLARRGDPDR